MTHQTSISARMGTAEMGGTPQNTLPDIDRLIHEPARLLIMANLYVVESADFLFLMNQTGITQGNLSSHLTKLEDGGYIDIKKEFKGRRPYTMVSITRKGQDAFRRYSEVMKKVLV
jgi:DNA-binding MarR family transcriptional regulator